MAISQRVKWKQKQKNNPKRKNLKKKELAMREKKVTMQKGKIITREELLK